MANKVALFITCLVENIRPKIGFDTISLLEDAGYEVLVPGGQVCCGQPNYNSGDRLGAISTAKFVIDQFSEYEFTVAPSGSCAGMLKHHYPELLEDNDVYRSKAEAFAAKVFELSQFLDHVGYEAKPVPSSDAKTEVTYHDACTGLRELGIKQQPRQLLSQAGVSIAELKDTESCCGFGGTFCVKYPDVSSAMVDRKLEDIKATGQKTVVAGDLGCLMNIEGRLVRQSENVEVKHFAEVLVEGLVQPNGAKGEG